MLAIFIQRGRPDAVQLTARQSGLQKIGRIHRALACTGTDQRVHFVDEQNNLAVGSRHIMQHGFQAFFKLAAKFGTRDQRAHIERQQFFVLQTFGHIAVNNTKRHALGNRCLADPRLADEHRIVFGATR